MPVVRNRRNKTKAEWAQIYAQLRRDRREQKYTAQRGFWILRSYATKLFSDSVRFLAFLRHDPSIICRQIAPRDLDSILPITRTPNPRGGVDDIMQYNLCDVAALVLRLQPTHGPDDRAPARGLTMVTTAAKKWGWAIRAKVA